MSKARTDYDHLIKLLLIGDSGVGKSCLLLRFSEDSFTNSFITTIGYSCQFSQLCINFLLAMDARIDFKIKNIHVDNKWIRLQIWDTAGQERFRTITSAYYRRATGILLVYDVSDEGSFKNVRNWMQNIKQHASDQVSKVLIGNKSDMTNERVVSREKGEALARELGIPFIESSAKTGDNVAEVFTTISREVLKKLGEEQKQNEHKSSTTTKTNTSTIALNNNSPSSGKSHASCC